MNTLFSINNVVELLDNKKNNYRKYDPGDYLYKLLMARDDKFSDSFIELAYTTLIAWNMNSRRAKLAPFSKFKNSLIDSKENITNLYSAWLGVGDDKFADLMKDVKNIYDSVDLVDTNSKLVTFSKTMHFYLPKIIMPIDRTYTLKFYFGNDRVPTSSDKQFSKFLLIHKDLNKYVYEKQWYLRRLIDNDNPSITKLVDNMIIGKCL